MRLTASVLSLVFTALLLAGCTVGPRYQRPSVSVPSEHRGQVTPADAASLADQGWWEVFHDDVLQSLIAEALKNNYDVRIAAWRVEEARANAGIVRSQVFPAVQGQAQTGYGRQDREQGGLIQYNVSAAWELDLWGRIRRSNEAALADYLATEEARRGVLLSLVSEVATRYFQLRELDLQLEIARNTSGAFQETFNLFDQRLQGGAASALETSSAEASLASTAANIPDLERQITAEENDLSFLLGRNPGTIDRGAALNDQFLPPDVPPGLPSDLLERRPDLREAEQNLVAANADVGIADADFFPRISLTGAFGGVSPHISELFPAGRTWSIAGGLLTPVFQGRRLREQHRAAVARWEQARARYEQRVTNAFSEVSTTLVAYQKFAAVEKERTRAVTAYREAFRLSNLRYTAGLSGYLEVLQSQQQLFPAEIQLAQARYNRLAALVQLYQVLGGGWQQIEKMGGLARADQGTVPEPKASGDPLGDAFTKELKALAGTWSPVSAENNGYKASEGDLKGTRWIRDADGKWTMWRGDKAAVEWAVQKIDATKNPKTIDIEITAGAYKGVVYLGIYELDGDTLRICFALPDKPERPTEFSASKGSLRALSEFKREKD